jgi:hyaluronan synthase
LIATLLEFFRFLFGGQLTLFLIIVGYFWGVWSLKLVLSRSYKPVKNGYSSPVTVLVPTYNEDTDILHKSLNKIKSYPDNVVSEIIVITDTREPDLVSDILSNFAEDARFKVLSSDPGKRPALALGIASSKEDIIVVIESDTFVNNQTIPELIKPFEDPDVGGVVADQRIYKPYTNIASFFNMVSERIKYLITVPMLSIFNQVTVLGGRCVAYRKKAVLPLLSDMLDEKFIRTQCISGDDGRFTSLLLENGWKTKYQSTSYVETVSPSTIRGLLKQRLRWFRNSARRTSRALTWDGLWVWKKGAALLQMLSTWVNTVMMLLMLYVFVNSILSLNWFWFGTTWFDIILRIGILSLGLVLTRFVKILFPIRGGKKRKWLWLILLPWFLFTMFWVKIYSLVTMNKQGWLSRKHNGPGGFYTIEIEN